MVVCLRQVYPTLAGPSPQPSVPSELFLAGVCCLQVLFLTLAMAVGASQPVSVPFQPCLLPLVFCSCESQFAYLQQRTHRAAHCLVKIEYVSCRIPLELVLQDSYFCASGSFEHSPLDADNSMMAESHTVQ